MRPTMSSNISEAKLVFALLLLLLVCGCAGFPARPHIPINQILVEQDKAGKVTAAKAYGRWFDDYDETGTVKKGAEKLSRPLHSIKDLRGWVCFDSASIEAFKVWMGEVRIHARNHCK